MEICLFPVLAVDADMGNVARGFQKFSERQREA